MILSAYFRKSHLLLLCLASVLLSTCQKYEPTSSLPAPSGSYSDTTFWQEYHVALPVSVDDKANEVRSIALDGDGNAWIATAAGVFTNWKGKPGWTPALSESDQGPAFAVASDHESVWVGTWNGVYRFREGKIEKMTGPESPIGVLCPAPEGMYALGPNGVWLHVNGGWQKKIYPLLARSVRDAVSDENGGLWIASDVGLYHCTTKETCRKVNEDQLISAYIRGVSANDGKVWAAGLGGVTILSKEKKERLLLPENGIPSVAVNCIKKSPDGVMWVGTDVGVVRYQNAGDHSLLFSRRWLLDDKVTDIDFDKEGNAWIATPKGVSVIRRKKMTLASKQEYFYDVLMRRHIREPWIAGQCRLPFPGDTTQWEPEDDDNDGEYTGNYLAMESFRFAATKSEDAREKAVKAFRFLKLLQEVTETDGFFARTIVPADWTFVHDGNRTYTDRQLADELVREPRFKPVTIRWRKSADGKWMWKGDTSSDEICGHMFGYFLFYELVASEEEKEIVRTHVAKIVDHLMAHDLALTDVDGKPTRWGIWSPDKLNRDPEWSPDRSLNSMELLSFVKLAFYMTGDQKYQDEYLRLIREEGYLDNMSNISKQNRAWFIYYDVILAAYQYPILLRCEKDPALLAFYEQHIDQWIATRKADKNPLINFIYSYARNKPLEIASSVDFLRDTPLDLIDWPIDHSKRQDISMVHQPVLDEVQVNELQPASIRATVRWDKNPWGTQSGNPSLEREPVFWLLPYWMGRYMEMIQ